MKHSTRHVSPEKRTHIVVILVGTQRRIVLGMAPKPDPKRDEPVKIDLDPEVAFKALLKVDPDSEPVTEDDETPDR